MYLPYYVDCLALSLMKERAYWLRMRRTLLRDMWEGGDGGDGWFEMWEFMEWLFVDSDQC